MRQYTAFDVVVIAASVGGVQAIPQILSKLPPDFPAAVAVIMHISHPQSHLVRIFEQATSLPVTWAHEGNPLLPGEVLVAPPNFHLMIRPDRTCHVSQDAAVNYVRPSADVLLATAAQTFGKRVLGVILTGSGRDGAVGARAVKNAGGRILVQEKESCTSFEMPRAVIESGAVDFILPLNQIPSAIHALVAVPGANEFFCVSPDFAFTHVAESRGFSFALSLS